MIRRTNDYSGLSNKDLNNIADAIKKSESKKLFDTFEDKNLAHIAAAELKVKGMEAQVFQAGNKYQVYSITPESIKLEDAEKSGQFKKIANSWGRYCFQRESAIGMFQYNYNDGSIWKLSSDEEGNTVLIKEVAEDDEENVIRGDSTTKTASFEKIAYTTDSTLKNVCATVFSKDASDNPLIDMVLSCSTEEKRGIFSKLDAKLEESIDETLQLLNSSNIDIKDLKSLVATALNKDINSMDGLKAFISKYVNEEINKIGSQRKNFS